MVNISKMIGEQHLEPGSKLPSEAELCEILNVSRVVIREALSGLSALGMIETRQGYGNIIMSFTNTIIKPHHLFVEADLESILDAIDLRLILESGVAGVAALNRNKDDLIAIEEKYKEIIRVIKEDKNNIDLLAEKDLDFHMEIAKSAGNKFICRLLSDITDILKTTINEAFRKNPDYLDAAMDEHRLIIEAIRDQDSEKSYKAMNNHLYITKLTLAKLVDKN